MALTLPDLETDFSNCSALVADCNVVSRSILVSQCRGFGMVTVTQATRAADARKLLEARQFDFVLCEQYFGEEIMTGQDMLDDLRRNFLLPFSTVFIMITGEATYTKVAEAAESALDGYLLKPHKASQLEERFVVARTRKISLQTIFDAIETQDFERAASLCLERFHARGLFWLYAARIGAELLLRLGRYDEAQALYQAVIAAKTLPWAKLGIARAELDSGQTALACTTLEKLIGEDPEFADAYDVMGRAQFELGQFDKALVTYRMAATLTPRSISRVQNAAMMSFYAGDMAQAEKLLHRAVRLGLESKMFDAQTLVLLAFTRLELENRRGLALCAEDIMRLLDRSPDNLRIKRLAGVVNLLVLIQKREFEQAKKEVYAIGDAVHSPNFDFESAGNLLGVLAQLHARGVLLENAHFIVETVGLRFCSNRPVTELLASCAMVNPAYAQTIREAQSSVLQLAEEALAVSLSGDPGAAVRQLLAQGKQTLNVRLIDNALALLQRHSAKVKDAEELRDALLRLRQTAGAGNRKISLGNQKRMAGGVVMRTAPRPEMQTP